MQMQELPNMTVILLALMIGQICLRPMELFFYPQQETDGELN